MAKKKSKWIKANAGTAKELDAARDRRDRDVRTGGSLRGATDGQLFAIDKSKGGSSRSLFKKDGLLTSERLTRPSTSIKPIKVPRPTKGQTVKAPLKFAPQRAAAPLPQRNAPVSYGFDAWGEGDDGLLAPVVDKFTTNGQRLNVRAPPRPEPSLAKAVEVIPAGGSYNPTYEQHQELLQSALTSELQRQAAKSRYASAIAPRAVDELAQLIEDARDVPQDEDEELGAAQPDGALGALALARREAKLEVRKSKAERNRLERKRVYEHSAAERERAKTLDKQLRRVQHIARELDAEEKARIEAKAAMPLRPEQVAGVPKKLGKFRQRAEPWAVLLTDELPSSLRTLPPAANLLSERFRSVTKRNLLEPRMAQTKRRKYALKEYTKKGFKEEDWQKL